MTSLRWQRLQHFVSPIHVYRRNRLISPKGEIIWPCIETLQMYMKYHTCYCTLLVNFTTQVKVWCGYLYKNFCLKIKYSVLKTWQKRAKYYARDSVRCGSSISSQLFLGTKEFLTWVMHQIIYTLKMENHPFQLYYNHLQDTPARGTEPPIYSRFPFGIEALNIPQEHWNGTA